MKVPDKNLLIISNMYPSKRSKTYGIFVKNQVDQLRHQGYRIDLLTTTDPRRGKYHVIKKYILWFFKALFILIFKGRKYHAVHVHYIFPSGWLGLLFKRFYKTKLIVTSHGGDIDQMPSKGKFIFRQTEKILNQADDIVAVGKHLKQEMMDTFHVPEDKISILNMGVNREVFRPKNKEEVREQLELSEEDSHLLFVGNIIKQKGISELLEAFTILKEKYSNLHLHMIGSSPDGEFKKYVKEYIEIHAPDHIHLHSSKKQEEIALWMAASDVFVLPSHIEGFGLVALEAMSVHTPVVGTEVGGLKYLLQDSRGILVESQNEKSLAEGIEKALTDKELLNSLQENGEIAAQENDQKLIIKKLCKLYE